MVVTSCADGSKDALKVTVQEFPASYKRTVDTLLGNAGTEVGFVLVSLNGKKRLVYNADRIDSGFLPASTFKIFSSLVFLQEGVITDSTVIKWDSVNRDWDKWNRDMTLKDAFRYSAVWVYQELARELGRARIQYWLTRSDYGNATTGGDIDNFWLEGSLKITPRQQVDFLRKLYRNELPFDAKVQQQVKDLMDMESTDHYSWHYKTGWATKPKSEVVWNVGFIETAGGVYFYALNLEPTDNQSAELRKTLPRKLLKALDIFPVTAR